MTDAESYEEEKQRILKLFYELIEPKIRDLANLWEERDSPEFKIFVANVERLEPKVVKLLEVLSTSRRHSAEYKAKCEELVSLLHNVQVDEEWRRKVIEDLNFFVKVTEKVDEAIKDRKKLRIAQQQAPPISATETPEDRRKRERDELRPPTKSFQELIETTDRTTWKTYKNSGNQYFIPYPPQQPKSYYIIPHPQLQGSANMLVKVYPDIQYGDTEWDYDFVKIAWISARVLERADFDLNLVEITWEAEGEKGIAKKIRK